MRDFNCFNTYYVYIMFNTRAEATYIGVTNDIYRRVHEHKNGLVPGYTKRKRTNKLAYYETYADISDAIWREKALKDWHRAWKYRLIETTNPDWQDLAKDWDYKG